MADLPIENRCNIFFEEWNLNVRSIQIEGLVKGSGRHNLYCRLSGGYALMVLRHDRIVVIDSKWIKELAGLSFAFRTKKGRFDVYCRLKDTSGKTRYIPVGKIICDLESGMVSGLHRGMVYPYNGEECHHKKDRLDNRAVSLESLLKEEHRKRHMNLYGNTMKSHNKMAISIAREDYERMLEEAASWQGKRGEIGWQYGRS